MTVTQPILKQVPEDREGLGNKNMYRCGNYQELDERDIKYIVSFDRVYYRYESGFYEGSGYMIGIKDGKWYGKDMGHCSCYGPTDGVDKAKEYNSFEECLKDADFTDLQKEYIRKDYL